ncbi:DUF4266 domain-containing protein [Vibrio coralliilyticus]|uniref:DUF4266 domain-containing protein n=1 Tax=Vibrio coralliilyticus TaxID=190893 RepID=UPI00148DC607|nr:DUF4266 domain-containing protein [Vibrio coralliilyticus]NOH53539.1 DUF4266 domain-containing protein [Vibrio coralliilyticus]
MKKGFLLLTMFIPAIACAAPKVDLSQLGKKPIKSETTSAVTSESSLEEEVISSQVYTSGSSEIGVRRNVELVKPKPKELKIVKPKPVNNEKSSLAFVDEALGIEPVKPWEKGTLAKKEMKPGGPVPEFDLFSEKVFAYKQGSVGGGGVGGGGCGCN